MDAKSRALSRVSVPISTGIVPFIELALTLKNSVSMHVGYAKELVCEDDRLRRVAGVVSQLTKVWPGRNHTPRIALKLVSGHVKCIYQGVSTHRTHSIPSILKVMVLKCLTH